MAEFLDELGYPKEVTKEEVVSAFLQTIQRTLNCLSDQEQHTRRKALEKLHVCLLKDDGAGSLPPLDVLQAAWDERILELVLRRLSDPTERCRELAIQLIREVAHTLAEVDRTLKETVLVMAERMGQIPALEDSEELRMQLFSLLIDVLLPECDLQTLQAVVDPLHRVLAVTLFDHFHEVQKRACSVLVTMASRDPDVFGNKTGIFLKALVPGLNHSHSRVRIAILQAIDAMVQCGLTASMVAQHLGPGTKPLAFDHSTSVRELFFASVANWLNIKERSKSDEEVHKCVVDGTLPRFHIPELLPLLLLGVSDEVPDLAASTLEKLEVIGEVYKKFIDQLDTRTMQGRHGERFNTEEEDAKILEQIMEEDRKCQERHEEELRQLEEQRRAQQQGPDPTSPPPQNIASPKIPTAPSAPETATAGEALVEQVLEDIIQEHEIGRIRETHAQDEESLSDTGGNKECGGSPATGAPEISKGYGGDAGPGAQEEADAGNAADAEMTAERIYDTDLKQYNADPGRIAAHARQAKRVYSGRDDRGEAGAAGLSVEAILDTDLRIFNEEHFAEKARGEARRGSDYAAAQKSGGDVMKAMKDEGDHDVTIPGDLPPQILEPKMEAGFPSATTAATKADMGDNSEEGSAIPRIIPSAAESNESMSSEEQTSDRNARPPSKPVLEVEITGKSHHAKGEVEPKPECESKNVPAAVKPRISSEGHEVKNVNLGSEGKAGECGGKDSKQAAEKNGEGGLHVLTNDEVVKGGDDGWEKGGTLPGTESLQLPKPFKGRPGAGCRLMVEAFLRPMLSPALQELKQWTTPTRLGAARLLHTTLVLAEGHAKEHLDILIPAFCSAVGDDDLKVAERVVLAVHVLGFHVSPQKWLPLVLPPLANTRTSQAQRANVLVIVAALLYGTPRSAMEEKHVVKLSDALYQKEVCCSDHSAVQNQLLSVVTNITQVAGPLCKSSSFKLFVLLVQLQSVEGDAQLQKRSGQILNSLADVLGMESARELYVQHIHRLMEIVTAGHEGWSSGLPGKLLFQTFMRNAGDTVGPHLESLMPLFGVCLQSDQDPALRISFLQLLDELFEKPELGPSWAPLAPHVIGKLLVPCAVWRATKTEAAIRYGAMVALGSILRRGLCSKAHMEEIMQMPEGFLPVIKTCLDEDYFLDVRRVTTHVMFQFLRIAGPILNDEERSGLIKVLEKRMDDSNNTIRIGILPAVAAFFSTMPPTFSDSAVKDFLSFLVIHMDDQHPQIQEGVCKATEACAIKKPDMVEEVLRNVRKHHRNPQYLDRVLAVAAAAKRG